MPALEALGLAGNPLGDEGLAASACSLTFSTASAFFCSFSSLACAW